MTYAQLLARRDRLLSDLRSADLPFRGSLVELHLTCGKKRCRCQEGHRHRAFHVSFRAHGRAYVLHLPKGAVAEVRKGTQNWLRLKTVLEELAVVQVQLWKEEYRKGRQAVERKSTKAR